MKRTIGAFIFPEIWQAWTQDEARRAFKTLRDFGINAIVTESEDYRDDLIGLAHHLNLQFIGGIACFSEHARNHQLLRARPELWPVLENGQFRPQMEWYIGVTPTFDDYRGERLDLIERVMREHELDGMCLDFIRWPMHWELELRPGAPEPVHSGFDPHSISVFLHDAGLELPSQCDTTVRQAAWILSQHRVAWIDFICRVITSFVAQARSRIRAHRGDSALLGMYLVPAMDERRAEFVGQRAGDLAPLVDYFAPMAYHAIVHQTAGWVTQVLDDVVRTAPGKTLPVLQVDSAEGTEMGADWGPSVSPEEWEHVASDTLNRHDLLGLVAFTGTSLFRDNRGERLRKCIALRA